MATVGVKGLILSVNCSIPGPIYQVNAPVHRRWSDLLSCGVSMAICSACW